MKKEQEAQREMPRYKCHKQVWALKIKREYDPSIGTGSPSDGSRVLEFEEEGYASIRVGLDWALKHNPAAGGYYVVYADGYTSWSPGKAFEEGYTIMNEESKPSRVDSEIEKLLKAQAGFNEVLEAIEKFEGVISVVRAEIFRQCGERDLVKTIKEVADKGLQISFSSAKAGSNYLIRIDDWPRDHHVEGDISYYVLDAPTVCWMVRRLLVSLEGVTDKNLSQGD